METENTQEKEMTLVLGGTGKTGRRVAARLQARGLPVRIGSRSGEPPFDWETPDTWATALDGVSAAYVSYYPDVAIPGAPEAVRAFTELAVQSGTRRLVLLSGRGEEEAQRAELAVREVGDGGGADGGRARGRDLRAYRSQTPDLRGGARRDLGGERTRDPLRPSLPGGIRA